MRRPVLTICTALGVLVLLALGTWQVARLQWKLGLIERTEARVGADPVPVTGLLAEGADPDDLAYTPVTVSGGFPTADAAHVFGTHEGRAGWFVFQPVLLDTPVRDARYLFLNRGFVAQEARQAVYPLPEDGEITGLLRTFEEIGGVAALVRAPNDPAADSYYDRQFATLTGAFAELGPPGAFVSAVYVDSTMPTTLPRGGTTRLDFSNRHLGYAITWYGLAGGLVLVYLAMVRRR